LTEKISSLTQKGKRSWGNRAESSLSVEVRQKIICSPPIAAPPVRAMTKEKNRRSKATFERFHVVSRTSRCALVGCAIFVSSVLMTSLTLPADVSASKFLTYCQAAPEPCKEKILAYVKFLADGELIDRCILQLPASEVAAKLVGYMRGHPESGDKDWVDCLDDAIATLKLCNS
jgi:hypothetical protein